MTSTAEKHPHPEKSADYLEMDVVSNMSDSQSPDEQQNNQSSEENPHLHSITSKTELNGAEPEYIKDFVNTMKGFFILAIIVNIVVLLLIAIITVAIVSSTVNTSPVDTTEGLKSAMSQIDRLVAETQFNISQISVQLDLLTSDVSQLAATTSTKYKNQLNKL